MWRECHGVTRNIIRGFTDGLRQIVLWKLDHPIVWILRKEGLDSWKVELLRGTT